jgi:hypothetical protein
MAAVAFIIMSDVINIDNVQMSTGGFPWLIKGNWRQLKYLNMRNLDMIQRKTI